MSKGSRAASVDGLPLSVVLDGPRPGRDDPGRDRVWLELRSSIRRVTEAGRFDVRRVLALDSTALRQWTAARTAFLAGHFQGDPRVAVDL